MLDQELVPLSLLADGAIRQEAEHDLLAEERVPESLEGKQPALPVVRARPAAEDELIAALVGL